MICSRTRSIIAAFALSICSCAPWQKSIQPPVPEAVVVEDEPVEEPVQTGSDMRAVRWYLLRAQEAQARGDITSAQLDLDRAYRNLAELEASDSIGDTTRATQLAIDIEQTYLHLLPNLESFSPDSPLVLMLQGLSKERIEDFSDDASQIIRIHQLSLQSDMPIDANARVAASIHFFQTRGRQTYTIWSQRSGKYRDMIWRIFKEMDLPQDLLHIAMIESGFNPNAYSRARAVGLWQFVASTGKMEGLEQTHWIDERRDPIKSTHAAARHLKSLYAEFGDWRLALAAYNSGRGRVRRAIEKAGTHDFWNLPLPKETRNYVPLFMAATIISKDPAQFGFNEIEFEDPFTYDQVTLPSEWPYVDLRAAARTMNVTETILRNLNPELRQSITPPGIKKPYVLRIPVGTRSSFIDRYGRLSSSQKAAVYQYEVQQRDNLSNIAQAFGVSTRTIIAANSLRNPNRIYPGQRLYIPASPNAGKDNRDLSKTTYTVRQGDSLSQIARRHGVALNDLMTWNTLSSGLIRPNQRLTIWTQQIPRSQSKSIRLSANERTTHTVQQGETLWGIARQFNLSVESLKRWNDLNHALIKPGQVLVIGEQQASSEYTVVTGDTLYSIARKFGLQVEELAKKNNIALTTTLLTGTTLKIPTKVTQ